MIKYLPPLRRSFWVHIKEHRTGTGDPGNQGKWRRRLFFHPVDREKVLQSFLTGRPTPDTYNCPTGEKEVLQGLVDGASYKMIAAKLDIRFGTVHTHVKNIYEKLHVNSASEAVVKAIRQRLV